MTPVLTQPNLPISSQMIQKLGRDTLWVEVFQTGQKFDDVIVILTCCDL